jgi:protein-tyrosine phosphatase
VNIPLHDDTRFTLTKSKLIRFLFHKNGDTEYVTFCRAYYQHIAFEQTHRIRQALNLLAIETNLPAVIYCNAGKDRTGLLAALIQLIAGVPFETVREDYLLTNLYYQQRLAKFTRYARILTLRQLSSQRITLVLSAHPQFLEEVHTNIIRDYGSIESYLIDGCHIDFHTLAHLKNRLLQTT